MAKAGNRTENKATKSLLTKKRQASLTDRFQSRSGGLIPTVRIELPCVLLIGLMPMQLSHVRALYCHLGHTY